MILYLETSTKFCRFWLEEKFFEYELGREMSGNILRLITENLKEQNYKLEDLTGVAVFAGPGSFTGLRIGIVVANTLSDSLKIPIVSQSNSDFSKVDDINSKNDWLKIAQKRLLLGENDQLALPFYGREANITKPRK